MTLFTVAIQTLNGMITDVNWWPAMLARKMKHPITGDEVHASIKPWSLMPFGYYVAMFLRNVTSVEEGNWPFRALIYLAEYCYDLTDKKALTNAMAYLLAHNPDVMNDIKQLMQDNGYDFGQYDPD